MRRVVSVIAPATLIAGVVVVMPSIGSTPYADASAQGNLRVGADCTGVACMPNGTAKCSLKASACVDRGTLSQCIINTWNTACASEQSMTPGGEVTRWFKHMSCSGTWYEGWCEWDNRDQACRWHNTSGIFWCPGGKDTAFASQAECRQAQPNPLPDFNPNFHPPGI